MGTTKTASARALIDPRIKKDAEAILKELGLGIMQLSISRASYYSIQAEIFLLFFPYR
jgi:hypothetical protein